VADPASMAERRDLLLDVFHPSVLPSFMYEVCRRHLRPQPLYQAARSWLSSNQHCICSVPSKQPVDLQC
jgi:hypothetical protein